MNLKYYLRGLGLGIIVTAIIMGLSANTRARISDDEIRDRAKKLGMVESTVLTESVNPENTDGNVVGIDSNETTEYLPVESLTKIEPSSEKNNINEEKVDHEYKDESKQGEDSETIEAEKAETNSVATEETKQDKTKDEEQTQENSNKEGATQQNPEKKDSQNKDAIKEDTKQESKQDTVKEDTKQESKQDTAKEDTSDKVELENKATQTAVYSLTVVSGDSSYSVAKKLEAAGIVSSAQALDNYLCQHGYDRHISTGTYEITADMTEDQIGRMINRK